LRIETEIPEDAAKERVLALKKFSELTEREVLAIAIASEEEDSRIYVSFSEELADRYPATSRVFAEMAEEEDGHRRQLLEIYQQRFGQNLPAIRREDVTGYYSRRPTWLIKNLPLETIRNTAEAMEKDSQRFYVQAASASQDVGVRKLLGDLAMVERSHGERANALSEAILTESAREEEGKTAHKFFVL
jgi:rubrerythrin